MELSPQRQPKLNRFRRHPRVRIPTPFSCSLYRLSDVGWFRKPTDEIGVVYDLSLRGVRVTTEAPIRPGDEVALRIPLPKQISPAYIDVATVRWTKEQTYGIAFKRLSFSAQTRLRKYMAVMQKAGAMENRHESNDCPAKVPSPSV